MTEAGLRARESKKPQVIEPPAVEQVPLPVPNQA